MTIAKGMTNATVPMGGVFATSELWDAFLAGPPTMPDLFHGYTYSGHPLAAAAAIATLDVYRDDGIFENAKAMSPVWEDMLHLLRDLHCVTDIRNAGILGAIQLESSEVVGANGRAAFERLWDLGLSVRPVGDGLAVSPPLTITASDISQMGDLLRQGLTA